MGLDADGESGFQAKKIFFETAEGFFSPKATGKGKERTDYAGILIQHDDLYTIQQVLAGNLHAFADIVQRYTAKAMTLAQRMLKRKPDAEDAVQEAFIRAYNALPTFEQRSAFATWFYRIVYNVCASELRKKGIPLYDAPVDEDEHHGAELESREWIPDALAEEREFEVIVQQEIDALPLRYSTIITLFYVQDLGYDDICSILQLPPGTVKTHLFRARALLRSRLEKRYTPSLI